MNIIEVHDSGFQGIELEVASSHPSLWTHGVSLRGVREAGASRVIAWTRAQHKLGQSNVNPPGALPAQPPSVRHGYRGYSKSTTRTDARVVLGLGHLGYDPVQ